MAETNRIQAIPPNKTVSKAWRLVDVMSCITFIFFFWYLLYFLTPSLYNLASTIVSYICYSQARGSSISTDIYSGSSNSVDLTWHAPLPSQISNLSSVINGTGVWGFVFDSSFPSLSFNNTTDTTTTTSNYSASISSTSTYNGEYYNWCNMPHIHPSTYPTVSPSRYRVRYVEVIQRHHKRTPYASNLLPLELDDDSIWNCESKGDVTLLPEVAETEMRKAARVPVRVDAAAGNPFSNMRGGGGCRFPQLTGGGLEDAWMHGRDLWGVYGAMLHLLPSDASSSSAAEITTHTTTEGDVDAASKTPGAEAGKVVFRITNNPITSQVAGMLMSGMLASTNGTATMPMPVLIQQPPAIDSLEPRFPCPAAAKLFASYAVGSSAANWTKHLDAAKSLFGELDAISGVDPGNADWHSSVDHYFDNLSARLCHAHLLPCRDGADGRRCISRAQADAIFRLGEYEYSYIYRDAPESLAASVASFGVWVAELGAHLRDVAYPSCRSGGDGGIVYRHNVAHDGSLARLLSILQVEQMVWPPMGDEVVFELFEKVEVEEAARWFVRILWGGRVLRSSSPALAVDDGKDGMIKLDRLLAYIDGLVGRGGGLVPGLCRGHE